MEAVAQISLSKDCLEACCSPWSLLWSLGDKEQQEPDLCSYKIAAGLRGASSAQRPRVKFCGRRFRFWKWSESPDLADPVSEVGDPGEDAGVNGIPALQAPAGQSYQDPCTDVVADKGSP